MQGEAEDTTGNGAPDSKGLQTPQDVQRLLDRLSDSTWAFSALAASIELGLLDALGSSCTAAEAAAATGIPDLLAQTLLDTLAALGLARREGNGFVPAGGLALFLQVSHRGDLLPGVRSTHFQSRQLVDAARRGTLHPGWEYDDPEVLQAQGETGRGLTQGLTTQVLPFLPDLGARLHSPGAAFLDVGIGVGIISIEMCRAYPRLQVVGLEPRAASAEQARRNIAAAGLADRIELRSQRVEDLPDREAFDLAYLPQVFMPVEVVERGLSAVRRALRPGGWVVLIALSVPGEDLPATLKRLLNVLWGGSPLQAEEVAGMVRAAGLESVQTGGAPGSPATGIMGRRPVS
jgi:2-polyprenyl-3-methyl-5-hydroxy-6-metoxy-1,4-benzoquinol methylase